MIPKSILLFGGSFNPPHLGHLQVIRESLKLIPNIDELWLVPCYNHAFQKDLAPAKDRLAMCELLIQPSNRLILSVAEGLTAQPSKIKICDIEIAHHTSGSTYETLQLLRRKSKIQNLPRSGIPLHGTKSKFYFLIGSDQLPTFHKWHRYQELLKEMTFYVYPRIGFPMKPLYPNMIPLKTTAISDISSTQVRQKLARGESLSQFLPQSIIGYLHFHHLFQ